MDATAELTYVLELRDTTDLALGVFDDLAPALEAWQRGRAEMERPTRAVGDPGGPEAFNTAVTAQRDVFVGLEAFLSLWARASLLVAPSPRSPRATAARGAHLRRVLGIGEDHAIANRALRDHWTHLDERLDRAVAAHPKGVLRQRFTRSGDSTPQQRAQTLRLVELDTLTVHILGEAFPLRALYAALEDVNRRAIEASQSWGRRWRIGEEEEESRP